MDKGTSKIIIIIIISDISQALVFRVYTDLSYVFYESEGRVLSFHSIFSAWTSHMLVRTLLVLEVGVLIVSLPYILLPWFQCIIIKNEIFEKYWTESWRLLDEPVSQSPSCLESRDQSRKSRKDLRKKV